MAPWHNLKHSTMLRLITAIYAGGLAFGIPLCIIGVLTKYGLPGADPAVGSTRSEAMPTITPKCDDPQVESLPAEAETEATKQAEPKKPAKAKAKPKEKPKAGVPAKAPTAKVKAPKPKAKAKPNKVKEGLPGGVQRAVAALSSLRGSATAEAIAEQMGIAKPAVFRSLGAVSSDDPATAIGAGLVTAVAAGGPDANEGERMLRYQLTASGKKLAEQAAKTAGSAKKAAQRPMSQIQAAIEVLRTAKEALNPSEIMAAVDKKGLWSSKSGATPVATLSAAIGRDAASEKPRFKKISKGHYLLTALGAKS